MEWLVYFSILGVVISFVSMLIALSFGREVRKACVELKGTVETPEEFRARVIRAQRTQTDTPPSVHPTVINILKIGDTYFRPGIPAVSIADSTKEHQYILTQPITVDGQREFTVPATAIEEWEHVYPSRGPDYSLTSVS